MKPKLVMIEWLDAHAGRGWTLTLAGNFTYCMSCDEPEEA